MMIINFNTIQVNWLGISFLIIFLIVSSLLMLYKFIHNPKLQDKLSVLYENTTNFWNKKKLYHPRTKSKNKRLHWPAVEALKTNFFCIRDESSELYKFQINLLNNWEINKILKITTINLNAIKISAMWSWLSGVVASNNENNISKYIRNWWKINYIKTYWNIKKNIANIFNFNENIISLITKINHIYVTKKLNSKLNPIFISSLLKEHLCTIYVTLITKLIITYRNQNISEILKVLVTSKKRTRWSPIWRYHFQNNVEKTTKILQNMANLLEKNIINTKTNQKPLYLANYRDQNNIQISKLMPYECGFEVFGDARMLFDVHFYLVSMLFLIFDIEVAYLFPYILCANVVGTIGFKIMLTFLGILTIGLVYEWFKGALNWLQTIYKKHNETNKFINEQNKATKTIWNITNEIENKFLIFDVKNENTKNVNFTDIQKSTNLHNNHKTYYGFSILALNQYSEIDFTNIINGTLKSNLGMSFDFINISNYIFHFFSEIILTITVLITIFLFVFYKVKGFISNTNHNYVWTSYVIKKMWMITTIALFISLLFYIIRWMDAFYWIEIFTHKLLNYIIVIEKQSLKGGLEYFLMSLSFILKNILPNFILDFLNYDNTISIFQNFPTIFNETLISNKIIASFKIAIIGFSFILILFSLSYQLRIKVWEFNTLFILFLCFALTLLSANNYFVFFVTIEGMNLCLFILISLSDKYTSIEVAIKYLILNVISTAALLIGICFTYFATGSLQFDAIELSVIELLNNVNYHTNQIAFIKISVLALFVGLFFKLSIAPFHFWTLDIYEGTSYPILSILAILLKTTIFGIVVKLLTGPYSFIYYFTDFKYLFFYAGTFSIIIGGILGLIQWTIKRFFAATSINNMGFIIICLSSPLNIETSLYYLFIYNTLLILTFAIFSNTWLITRNRQNNFHFIISLNGLASKNQKISGLLTILILSMSGLPPFILFFNKMSVLLILFQEYIYVLTNYFNGFNFDFNTLTSNLTINNNIAYYTNSIYNNELIILLAVIAIIIISVVVGYFYIKLVLTFWLNKPNQNFIVEFNVKNDIGLQNIAAFKNLYLNNEYILGNITKNYTQKFGLKKITLLNIKNHLDIQHLLFILTIGAYIIGFVFPLILIIEYGLLDSINIFNFNFHINNTKLYL